MIVCRLELFVQKLFQKKFTHFVSMLLYRVEATLRMRDAIDAVTPAPPSIHRSLRFVP